MRGIAAWRVALQGRLATTLDENKSAGEVCLGLRGRGVGLDRALRAATGAGLAHLLDRTLPHRALDVLAIEVRERPAETALPGGSGGAAA